MDSKLSVRRFEAGDASGGAGTLVGTPLASFSPTVLASSIPVLETSADEAGAATAGAVTAAAAAVDSLSVASPSAVTVTWSAASRLVSCGNLACTS